MSTAKEIALFGFLFERKFYIQLIEDTETRLEMKVFVQSLNQLIQNHTVEDICNLLQTSKEVDGYPDEDYKPNIQPDFEEIFIEHFAEESVASYSYTPQYLEDATSCPYYLRRLVAKKKVIINLDENTLDIYSHTIKPVKCIPIENMLRWDETPFK